MFMFYLLNKRKKHFILHELTFEFTKKREKEREKSKQEYRKKKRNKEKNNLTVTFSQLNLYYIFQKRKGLSSYYSVN